MNKLTVGTNIVFTTNSPGGNESITISANASGITNGLATVSYVNTATNGHVTSAITMG